MDSRLFGENSGKDYRDFIVTVIKGLTREYLPNDKPYTASNWWTGLFTSDRVWKGVGFWLASMAGTEFIRAGIDNIVAGASSHRNKYSIVSFNYDLVLETVLGSMTREYSLEFSGSEQFQILPNVSLFKVHGCLSDPSSIVPPIWNKSTRSRQLKCLKSAAVAIRNAQTIRMLGYSFPENDSYLRYLLLSALKESTSLTNVEVLCLDPHGDVRKRYEDAFHSDVLRFYNGSTSDLFRLFIDIPEGKENRATFSQGKHESAWNVFLDNL